MTDDLSRDARSPAEQGLIEHLDSLGANPPEPPPGLTTRVVRTARWQSAVRPYLETAGGILGAAGSATRVLLDPRRAA